MQVMRRPIAIWMSLSALALVGGIIESCTSSDIHPSRGVPIAIGMAAGMAIAWWSPLAGMALQLVVCIVQIPFGHEIHDMGVPIYAVAGTTGMLTARERGWRLWAGMAMALGILAGIIAPDSKTVVGDLVFGGLFVIGLPALAGRMYQSRARLNEQLRQRARHLTQERHTRAEEAAAAERRRIAGELHDLVAHGVSGMVIQAAAARRLLRTGDPRASEAIRSIEEGGREALNELRQLLGVLRREDDDLALAPQPSLARLGTLVAQMREAGLDVELRVSGEAPAIGPGLDVAGYRVVEEALASARAAGRTEPTKVTVHFGSHSIDLAIEGATPDAGALVRLRERVDLFGGELVTGKRGSTPALRARLPIAGAAA